MSSSPEHSTRRSGGAALGVVVLAFLGVLLLFSSSARWLLGEWFSNGSFDHGLVVAVVAAVLLFRAAGAESTTDGRIFWPGAVVCIGLSLLWLVLHAANIAIGQAFLLPAMLLAGISVVLGLSVAARLAFPIAFFYFALPVWEPLKPFLRDLTIVIVEPLLKIGGVPAMIEGALVHIPAGTFRIANGCSGLNFFVVGLAIASLYGYLFIGSNTKRLLLIVLGAFLALFGNWIRVASIIAIGHQTNMQSGLIGDHQTYGWVIFALLQVVFFAVAMRVGRGERGAADIRLLPVADVFGAVAGRLRSLVVAVVALGIGPVWAATVLPDYSASAQADVSLPTVGDYQGPFGNRGGWAPVFQGASGERLGQYQAADGPVWLYMNVYLVQEQGRELIYLHNRIEGELQRVDSRLATATLASGESFAIRDLIVDQGFRQRRIMYWYEVGGERVATDLRAKALQARAVLFGNPAAGVVAVSAVCEFDCTAAGERILDFIRSLQGDFQLTDFLQQGAL